jgi:hypothetical protein
MTKLVLMASITPIQQTMLHTGRTYTTHPSRINGLCGVREHILCPCFVRTPLHPGW